MMVILLRTVVLYILLGLVMRVMGKRQLAQLETSELITTFLLSELAVLPLENRDTPISHAIFPILLLTALEIGSAMLQIRSPRLRRFSGSPPALLIVQGELDRDALRRNRLTPEELFSALRQQGIADPCEVEYAILEKNGSLSVIPWARYRPAVPADLGQDVAEEGLMHLLISDGIIQTHTLTQMGYSEDWLIQLCQKRGYAPHELFCLMCNDAQRVILIPSDHSGCARRAWKSH